MPRRKKPDVPVVFQAYGNSLYTKYPPQPPVLPFTNTVAPLWPATVTIGTQAAFTPGVWTGNISASRTWIFLLRPAATGVLGTTNYTGNAPNTVALHTPVAPAVAGDTLYIQETVYDSATGLAVGTATSAGIVLQAAVVPLTATLAATGFAWNVNETITPVVPVTANGGTPPYSFSTAGLPAGIVQNASNGQLSGTPLLASGLTSYVTTLSDSGGSTPVTQGWTATVSPVVAVTPLTLLVAVNNAGLEASSLPSAYNSSYSGQTITGSDGVVRHQRFTDFEGVVGNTVYLTRFRQGDGVVSTWFREELDWYHSGNDPETYTPATDYWMSFAIRLNEWPNANGDDNDRQILWQMHPNAVSPNVTDVSPNLYLWTNQASNQIIWSRTWDANSPTGSGFSTVVHEWSETRPANGTWYVAVLHYRGGWTTAQSPQTEVWRRRSTESYTKVVNRVATTDFNAFNQTLNPYQKIGMYKYNNNWNGVTTRSMYHSEQFRQQGTNLFANAAESVKNFT